MPYSDLSDAYYDYDPRYEAPTPPPEPERPIYDWYNKNISPIGNSFSEYLKRSGEALARIPQDISKNVAIPFLEQMEQSRSTDWSNQPFIGVGEKGEFTGRLPALAGYVAPYLLGAAPGGSGTLPAGVKLPGGKYGYPEGLEGGYHGTHAVFPPEPENLLGRFMNEKINTGEGAQAYGYGHYVGAKKGTGVSYMPDAEPVMHLEGKQWDPYNNMQRDKTWVPYHEEVAYDLLRDAPRITTPNGHMPDFDQVIGDLKDGIAQSQARYDRLLKLDTVDDRRVARTELSLIEDDKKALDFIERNRDKITMETPGSLYHVEMKPAEESLMHWDKKIKDQPQDVQDKLKQVYDKYNLGDNSVTHDPWESFQEMPAGEWYRSTKNNTKIGQAYPDMTGNGQALSEAMKDAGIPGLRFADQQSRPLQTAKLEIDDINQNVERLTKRLEEADRGIINPDYADAGMDLSSVKRMLTESIEQRRQELPSLQRQIRDARILEFDGKPMKSHEAAYDYAGGDVVKQRALDALLNTKDVDIAINQIKAVMGAADRQAIQDYRIGQQPVATAGYANKLRSENSITNQKAVDWLEKNRDKINLKERDIAHNYVIFDPKDLNIIHREKNIGKGGYI